MFKVRHYSSVQLCCECPAAQNGSYTALLCRHEVWWLCQQGQKNPGGKQKRHTGVPSSTNDLAVTMQTSAIMLSVAEHAAFSVQQLLVMY